jgi:hypothetical protein
LLSVFEIEIAWPALTDRNGDDQTGTPLEAANVIAQDRLEHFPQAKTGHRWMTGVGPGRSGGEEPRMEYGKRRLTEKLLVCHPRFRRRGLVVSMRSSWTAAAPSVDESE